MKTDVVRHERVAFCLDSILLIPAHSRLDIHKVIDRKKMTACPDRMSDRKKSGTANEKHLMIGSTLGLTVSCLNSFTFLLGFDKTPFGTISHSLQPMIAQRLFALAILAFAGVMQFTSTAAASIITPSYSDLILGLRVITLYGGDGTALPAQGIGGGTNLMVNLGQASQFYNPSSNSFTVSGLVPQDLTTIYGANWKTRTDLAWGIVGTTGAVSGTVDAHAVKSTIWATVGEETPGVLSATPQFRLPASLQNGPISKNISPLFVGTAPFNGATSTSNSNTAAAISAGAQGSWSSLSLDNGSFGLGVSIEASTKIATGSYSVLDLYELQPNSTRRAGAYLGSFWLSDGGVLTFTVAEDADGDGLEDNWERQYFGDIAAQDGGGDRDGDGQINSEEEIFGTSPISGAERFGLSGIIRSGAAVEFSFLTIPSRIYQILYSTDLSPGSWHMADTVTGGATSAPFHYQDTNTERLANPKGFYKVSVTAP